MQSYHRVILDQKPCVVCYLDEFDRFLVGTYELYPTLESARVKFGSEIDDVSLQDDLNKINQRAGKLFLINYCNITASESQQAPTIDYQFDCHQGGGVFDAKVSHKSSALSTTIYVAHSNGSIGVYELTQAEGEFKISQKKHIKISEPSNLLTTIDIILENFLDVSGSFNNTETGDPTIGSMVNDIITGDSKGVLSVLDSRGLIQDSLGEDESIWQVKSLGITTENCMIIVGAENCSWYIYMLNRRTRKLHRLYKNQYKDFQAGVTSIYCLGSCDQQNHRTCELLLGSYDESLQAYQVSVEKSDNVKFKQPSVVHKSRRLIDGGGIWRLKSASRSKHQNSDKGIFIAAMYAGSFALEPPANSYLTSATLKSDNLVKLLEVGKLGLSNQPLHYDIDISYEHSSRDPFVCIADFNNSMCLLIPVKRTRSGPLL